MHNMIQILSIREHAVCAYLKWYTLKCYKWLGLGDEAD